MDIKKFVENINKKSRLQINEWSLNCKLQELEKNIKELQDKILEEVGCKSKVYREAEIKEILGLYKINNIVLEEKFKQTEKKVYSMIIELRKKVGEKSSLENIKDNIKDGFINPKYTLNKANMITVSGPSLNSLSKGEIMNLTGFGRYISFNSLEEIYEFLKKYNKLVKKNEGLSSFIIKGLTLYTTLEHVPAIRYLKIAFNEAYKCKYPEEFVGLSFSGKIGRFNKVTSHINEKNYQMFINVWNEYKEKIIQSIEFIREGYAEFERYYGLFSPEMCYEPDERKSILEEEIRFRREYENELIRLFDELKQFDSYALKYEAELKEIIDGFRSLEPNLEKEIKEYDEIFRVEELRYQKNIKQISDNEISKTEEDKKYIQVYNPEKARVYLHERGCKEEYIDEEIKKYEVVMME
ncbi:hypothetical protein [Clostridium beijerinckii]|uniref:hypothetical protein n=1 Tax=Clostridium beijerinckii TaxID=1520 RepID=UPI001360D990|nr:hypothetical protein [Clostridium beijerinckii]MZK49030.1 hypothetical protein [Clostridium beijerinckii]MZK57405.1 hypothetical protein [Clostridium beijerinckii]MZK67616.1 hypothetical protein [Clostridium beijerinckii]MZK72701.1 hypothetical protein [Clostridium beijerinckii]MZK82297.1 hypothetical protein [Clostridium beijerinckii]